MEKIATGHLHHVEVVAEGATPARWMLILHGILGSGGNLRTLAKRLAASVPDWGFSLVDLRMHGLSQGFDSPHTLAAAAADLFAIEAELAGPVAGVLGHSFGGKTALAYAGQRLDRGAPALEELVVLDASPSAHPPRHGATEDIVAMLEGLPETFVTREAFGAWVRARGYASAIAEWLAMNVRRDADAFRFRLDLKAIRALLDDYHRNDLWAVIEGGKAARRIDFVVAGKSQTVDAGDRARLDELSRRGLVHVHLLAGSAHWVHVDEPEALFALVRAALLEQNAAP